METLTPSLNKINPTKLLEQPLIDNKLLWDNGLLNLQTAAVCVANIINLFPFIEKKPATIQDLAENLSITQRGAEALVSILCGLELLQWQENHLTLTPLSSTYLTPNNIFYWGNVYGFLLQKPEHKILADIVLNAIKTNKAQLSFSGNNFTNMWLEGNITSEAAKMFTHLMHSTILAPTIGAIKTGAFDSVNHLLDVGGGSGCFGIVFVEKNLNSKATIFDLPPVCEAAKNYVESYQTSSRINYYPGNFFKSEWPKGHDGILFSQIFHDWPVEYCQTLAQSAYEALEPGGQIFIHEMLLNDNRSGPLTVACFDMLMLINHGAQQFTKTELFNLLSAVGFKDLKVTPGFGYFSLITGKKPG